MTPAAPPPPRSPAQPGGQPPCGLRRPPLALPARRLSPVEKGRAWLPERAAPSALGRAPGRAPHPCSGFWRTNAAAGEKPGRSHAALNVPIRNQPGCPRPSKLSCRMCPELNWYDLSADQSPVTLSFKSDPGRFLVSRRARGAAPHRRPVVVKRVLFRIAARVESGCKFVARIPQTAATARAGSPRGRTAPTGWAADWAWPPPRSAQRTAR